MAKKTVSKPTKTTSKKSTSVPTLQKDESVRIEKISNGYLAVKEVYDPKKGYQTQKVFMDKNPLEGM
jgi:hypothetical protein